MTVQEVVNMAVAGELKNLAVKNNTEAIISFINLGVIELYKRCNISTKVEVVRTSPVASVYTLRNKDVNQILSVYDTNNKELRSRLVLDDNEYDIAIVNYRTFILTKPLEEELLVVYSAAPPIITSLEDEIDIPYAMLEALLHYVGYRAHGSVDGSINAENTTHYTRFEKSCAMLVDYGYVTPPLTVSYSVEQKGFV